jgi:hypothetical protein
VRRGAKLGNVPRWELEGFLGEMLVALASDRRERRGKLGDGCTNGARRTGGYASTHKKD